ncbi:tubulin-specific chaperone cofactor E [Brachionus plicatilis]|uniref:Tubulin-specific chaperone cofactor E n=1 Tax=Brachionus plicatilis TaxID=10195 RepID=A0A3M7S846_BRAPC|nr:tubulin-specific chaperone cofactor E [Brachionus plicatilis]
MDQSAEIFTEMKIEENSLLEAIYERYIDLIDLNGQHSYSLHYKGGSLTRTGLSQRQPQDENNPPPVNQDDIQISISTSPRKSVFASISAVLSGKRLNRCGDCADLENKCQNLMELDISNNLFNDWNEIRKVLNSLKKLRHLNLTSNKLADFSPESELDEEKKIPKTIEYFNTQWPLDEKNFFYNNLKTLVLNECFVDLRIIECLLHRLIGLSELHLSRNNYNQINFSADLRKHSIKVLYMSNNLLDNWNQVAKLGVCFPNLEQLVLSSNPLKNFQIEPNNDSEFLARANNSDLFKNLSILNINKIKIDHWSSLDALKYFPNLKHIRIHEIPLLETIRTEEERHNLLVGYLEKNISYLNGSNIPSQFKESCERKFMRFFMDQENKPERYFELEAKHGKLNRLVDVNLDVGKTVYMKIKYDDKYIFQNIKIRQTVGELKKSLESFVGEPSAKFRIFYIDKEAESAYGHDELKLAKSSLLSLKLKDGDEFDICLKQASPKKSIR